MLLHGWPQHWFMWRDVIPALASDGRRVIAPDLRGLGWSDAPKRGYLKQELADDVLALLDELGVERFDLIGHDWGAFAGFLICLGAPERVGHYVGCSIPHLWPPQERPSLRRLLNLWYQVALGTPGLGAWPDAQRPLHAAGAAGRALARPLLRRRAGRVRRRAARARARERDLAVLPHVPAARAAAADLRRDEGAHADDPDAPAVGQTRPDPPGLAHASGDHERYAPNMRIEWVDDTGHFLPEERPELVVAAGARAVRELAGGTASP